MEHPAGRKLQASDVELKGDSHSLDQKVQQPNEPSTNDGEVATIDCKQIAQKLIASTKQQSKMLAMNALLSAASCLDRADKSLGSRHIQCAYYLESLQILKSGRHDGACLLLLSAVSWLADFK